jgi:signal transduction histidine kinase
VGRLAAQITHEIRNPLSSLSLNTELLEEQIESGLDDLEAKGEARSLVKAMAREVDRLTGVTEEYLRFARMPKPTYSAVDLNDAMDELLAFMGPELAAAGVEAKRDWSEEPPRVKADAGQLRQVVLNLVRNAREAAGRGGHIRLRTRIEPIHQWGVVEVVDDGPGIPEAVRSHLFEPFYSTKEGGTGLGLALVQQVMHEHGGEVECESAAGKGTRFVLRWPLDVPELRAAV